MDAKKLEARARRIFSVKKTLNERKSTNSVEYQQWRESVAEANRKKHADPEIAKRIADGNRNRKERLGPEYSKRLSKGQRRRYDNMSEEERQAMSNRTKEQWKDDEYRERMMAYYSTPEYKEYITKRNQELAKDPKWLKKVTKNNQKKPNDPEYMKRLRAGIDKRNKSEDWIRKNCRPVKSPYGVFPKAKDSMLEYQKEYGGKIGSIAVKIRSWLKSDKKPEWKYLTWEEYDHIQEKR